ncbi:MAG: histidine phosphatase family protein [Anaerolineae bacterium]|nr:histidine phosphatase family protein [Anaerolineae bacterium]
MIVERVLLIRHGETDWNLERRWQGFEPTSLNANGLEQADTLAQYLRERPIGAVYCSDLPRALQTAAALAQVLGLEPRADIRWREIHVGIFQGLVISEVEQRYPVEIASFRSSDVDFVIPNGESRRMLGKRVYEAFEEVVEQPTGPEIAIVSHGGTIRRLIATLFGEAADSTFLPNTSITTFARKGAKWTLTGVAETPHLG